MIYERGLIKLCFLKTYKKANKVDRANQNKLNSLIL